MPRPKGSKKVSSHSTNPSLISPSSPISLFSPFPAPTSTSVLLSNAFSNLLHSSSDFLGDESHWMKTSVHPSSTINRGGRPKKADLSTANDESTIVSQSSNSCSSDTHDNDCSASRVVVNPAVLRYLEQNRHANGSSISTPSDSLVNAENQESFDHLLKSIAEEESMINRGTELEAQAFVSTSDVTELDRLIPDDLVWDFCNCSTDFLASARLAQWILTREQPSASVPLT